MKFRELPRKWKAHIIVSSGISALFLILLVLFNLFLNVYRAENAKQREKFVKNDMDLIGERIEIQRDGKASIQANL